MLSIWYMIPGSTGQYDGAIMALLHAMDSGKGSGRVSLTQLSLRLGPVQSIRNALLSLKRRGLVIDPVRGAWQISAAGVDLVRDLKRRGRFQLYRPSARHAPKIMAVAALAWRAKSVRGAAALWGCTRTSWLRLVRKYRIRHRAKTRSDTQAGELLPESEKERMNRRATFVNEIRKLKDQAMSALRGRGDPCPENLTPEAPEVLPSES